LFKINEFLRYLSGSLGAPVNTYQHTVQLFIVKLALKLEYSYRALERQELEGKNALYKLNYKVVKYMEKLKLILFKYYVKLRLFLL